MQPVRKGKAARRNRKPLAMLAALLGTALIIFLVYELALPKAQPAPRNEDERVPLIEREADTLKRIEVMPGKSEHFTLIQGDLGWTVDGQPDFLIDLNELNLMVKDFTALYANEFAGEVKPDEASLAALGLGETAPRAKASYLDGSALTLVFGNSAQTEIPADYLKFGDDSRVYAVSVETRDHFDRSLESLHQIPKINFTASLLDTIVVSGFNPFTLSQQEELWEITSPFLYPADSAAMRDLLNDIGSMRFALYAGKANDENLRRFGLEDPKRVFTFELAKSFIQSFEKDGSPAGSLAVPEQSLSIALGDDISGIGLYCLYDGSIYQASNLSMGFLRDAAPDRLLSPYPVTFPINRLERLVVEDMAGIREYRLEMTEKVLPNNQLATDRDGNILYEPYVLLDGIETDSDLFTQGYLKLMTLARSGRLPEGFQPESKTAARRYVFMTAQGERELALFPYDSLHYAMRVNGSFFDYVSKESAESIGL